MIEKDCRVRKQIRNIAAVFLYVCQKYCMYVKNIPDTAETPDLLFRAGIRSYRLLYLDDFVNRMKNL